MIDLSSRTEIQRYHAQNLRMMAKIERVQAKKFQKSLNETFASVAQDIVSHGSTQIDLTHHLAASSQELKTILLTGYKQTAVAFSELAFQKLEQSKSTRPGETKDWGGEFWRVMTEWMSSQAAMKIVGLVTTTKRGIARIIELGMQEGISHLDIAKRILDTGKILNASRAITIARTETHTVAVKAVDESVAATRVKFMREWSSTQDDRTRIEDKYSPFDHVKADGETVGQDEFFVRTGEKLSYPGDPAGSPGNIISCRCVVLYVRP